jgi:hypothetical protein
MQKQQRQQPSQRRAHAMQQHRRAAQLPALLLLALAAATAALLPQPAAANEQNHRYKDGEPVALWVNKVGPFNNPQETYNYYALPYCKARPADRPARAWGGLGEVLQGNELIHSQLDIKFKGARAFVLCFERRGAARPRCVCGGMRAS